MLSPFIVFGDQVTKTQVAKLMQVTCNNYGVFGIRGNFLWLSLVVLVLIFALLLVEKRKLVFVSLSAIFAGGASNFVDRINFGCVRDFITVGSFPSFNLADSAIAFGFCILVFGIVYEGLAKHG